MIANRTRVYEFFRSIGVVPDEHDGLDLPVTVEVMQERVDFLHKLGLTIEDIYNYPFVLGCSVKKNMIPVLDYLGKLGVRKSTFTEFPRRYPQVLHASLVVDLAPVVKYLQGMDIKPHDIPRVLEKYPEDLGFKLEGTTSTSVAHLIGIGVARREIGGLLTEYPEILGMKESGDEASQPTGFLNSVIGLAPDKFGKVEEKMPWIVNLSDRAIVKHVDFLKECRFSSEQVKKMVVGCPHFLHLLLESTIKPRHKMIAKKGVKYSLAWLINCSDEKFEEQMNYDSMDIEEMEIESSFHFNNIMKPRNDESSNYEDDDSDV
ncbi:unnamed protein product [Fraxinus pennsylvanica]|uniref:Uncharacterized protein n=1 Tax=Fraxinus pennsylvanica TaxID=56036 RepID=A0AAD2E1Z4_9LAMI|nr:unnamed protein product [Fraxinus pennsylvanica]